MKIACKLFGHKWKQDESFPRCIDIDREYACERRGCGFYRYEGPTGAYETTQRVREFEEIVR